MGNISSVLDSNYPLLQELKTKCKGTYNHSEGVKSLVEVISHKLNLDIDLMRACALYHDIGKIHNPLYFTENQINGENIHDNKDPFDSYLMITKHVADGLSLLINDSNFDLECMQIISQHHGNSVLKPFFIKSKSKDENLYRYKLSKPSCINSVVLMICDCVQAMDNSLKGTEKHNAEYIVNTIINNLSDDGQFDNVVSRWGDLRLIKECLIEELNVLDHKRIDYDKYNVESE